MSLCHTKEIGEMAAVLGAGTNEEEKPLLFCREAHVYGASVEAQYYAPTGIVKRGRKIRTKHIYCHSYADNHLTKNKDVVAREERQGQGYLPT